MTSKIHANTVTFMCNDYYIKSRAARSLAFADLQPVLEENQREGGNMEKAPEVWDARFAQLRLLIAEYARESGAVRVAGYSDPGIEGGSLCASGPNNR